MTSTFLAVRIRSQVMVSISKGGETMVLQPIGLCRAKKLKEKPTMNA